MAVSSVFVVSNSLRLRRFAPLRLGRGRVRSYGVRLGAAVLVAVALGACGGGGGPGAAAGTPAAPALQFTQADVDFAVHLSQHHGQALHLAELATTRGRSAEVKAIAAEIASAYAPQVDTLATWIRTWEQAGAELPGHSIDHDEAGPGMLPQRAIYALESLKGAAFDRRFGALMARHHRGGLQLVAAQLADGTNPDAKALAERLRDDQTRQLERLTR